MNYHVFKEIHGLFHVLVQLIKMQVFDIVIWFRNSIFPDEAEHERDYRDT